MKNREAIMHWLDLSIAVPTIGTRLEHTYNTAHDWLRGIRPTLIELTESHGEINISSPNIMHLTITTKEGYKIDVHSNNIISSFAYPYEKNKAPGELETSRYTTPIGPYSERIQALKILHSKILSQASRSTDLKINRVGIMANYIIDANTPPPGVSALLDSIGDTTNAQTKNMNLSFTIESSPNTQQHHKITTRNVPNDDSQEVEVQLDWQHTYDTSRTAAQLRHDLDKHTSNALTYFDNFGMGAF